MPTSRTGRRTWLVRGDMKGRAGTYDAAHMAISLVPSVLGDRTYVARGFDAPWRLPDGESTVCLADLFFDICRGQDPNIAGFSAASSVPGYTLWPYLRYSPLLADTWDFRRIGEVRGID